MALHCVAPPPNTFDNRSTATISIYQVEGKLDTPGSTKDSGLLSISVMVTTTALSWECSEYQISIKRTTWQLRTQTQLIQLSELFGWKRRTAQRADCQNDQQIWPMMSNMGDWVCRYNDTEKLVRIKRRSQAQYTKGGCMTVKGSGPHLSKFLLSNCQRESSRSSFATMNECEGLFF